MSSNLFSKIPLQEWLDTVPEKLITSFKDDNISPFSHASRVKDYKVWHYEKTPKPWQIIQSIHINANSTNKEILDLLNQGVNSLILNISSTLSEEKWKLLLNEVRTELIHFHLQGTSDGINSFLDFCKNNGFKIQGTYSLDEDSVDIKHTPNFFPLMKGNGSIEHEIAEIISKCYHASTTIKLENMSLSLQVTDHFLHNIAGIFALKIAWFHLAKSLDQRPSVPEIFTFNKINNEDSFEHYCIKATVHVASSIAGGASGTYLQSPTFSNHEPSFTSRIIHNIHYLCLLEGKMNKVLNPLEGSYYIEELSNNIAQKAWELFQKSLIK